MVNNPIKIYNNIKLSSILKLLPNIQNMLIVIKTNKISTSLDDNIPIIIGYKNLSEWLDSNQQSSAPKANTIPLCYIPPSWAHWGSNPKPLN